MTDIILETVRALTVGVIFVYLLRTGRREEIRRQSGWSCILTGFAFLLFGMIIDITDNFTNLNRYVIIGDTEHEAFLEKVVGYLCGFLFLAIGFWKWMPTVIALKQTQRELKKSHDELGMRVRERTEELTEMNGKLKLSEEKFSKAFHSSPYAMAVKTLDKGRLIEVNESFHELFGYSKEEAIGRTSLELNLYKNTADRSSILKILQNRGRVSGYPVELVRKSGEARNCLVTVENILIEREPHTLSVITDITDFLSAEKRSEALIIELEETLTEVKTLSGMLPICCCCKKIRDDKGYWEQVDVYITNHAEVEFSHGYCPECINKLYPNLCKNIDSGPDNSTT